MQHYSWDTVPVEVLSETISRKIITGDRLMVAQVFIKKGGIVPRHVHENEQVTYILEGALQFELEGQTVIVAKGQVLHIPSNVPHEAVALEDTIDLDIFNPPRQDWITGQDAYLRS
jgi:quercetin dioxygenase-like cupin family protein